MSIEKRFISNYGLSLVIPKDSPVGKVRTKQQDIDKSLEELVDEYQQVELNRDDHDKDVRERPTSISYRKEPAALGDALDLAKKLTSDSETLLTRCTSHQTGAWLRQAAGEFNLVNKYSEILKGGDGFPDTTNVMKTMQAFSFINPRDPGTKSRKSSWSTFVRAKSEIEQLASACGMDKYELFAIHLCYVISTNTSGLSPKNINQYFIPEVANFKLYLKKRAVWLQTIDNLLKLDIEAQEKGPRRNSWKGKK